MSLNMVSMLLNLATPLGGSKSQHSKILIILPIIADLAASWWEINVPHLFLGVLGRILLVPTSSLG